jgi:hypothetical protein
VLPFPHIGIRVLGFVYKYIPGTLAAYVHGCNIYLKDLQGDMRTFASLNPYISFLKRAGTAANSTVFAVTQDVVGDGSCRAPTEVRRHALGDLDAAGVGGDDAHH